MYRSHHITKIQQNSTLSNVTRDLDSGGGVRVVEHVDCGVLRAVGPRHEYTVLQPRYTCVVVIAETRQTPKNMQLLSMEIKDRVHQPIQQMACGYTYQQTLVAVPTASAS